ncbi:MAG: hypothetical protein JHC87_04000 [Thermoleophilaceae bacterium]|nr:hypothetical protein [Thermoleophilaceae bacterium]
MWSRRSNPLLPLVAVAFFAFASAAAAAPGDLDVNFGAVGAFTTQVGFGNDSANAVVLQPDGKIVAAGSGRVGINDDFAIARFNKDGSLDGSFGSAGSVFTDFASDNDMLRALALQPDGKIVAAGTSGGMFALDRYNSDGSLDPTFGTGGKLTTSIGGWVSSANAVAIQSDGKIVAAGYAYNGASDFALIRYNSDGSLDSSFDGDGMLQTDFGSGDSEYANGLAIQPDGQIVAAGVAYDGSNYVFGVARYNSDGSLDTAFDGDGLQTAHIESGEDNARAVALQPDGKIVVAGGSNNGSRGAFAVARFNPDGSLDNGFNGGGTQFTPFGGSGDSASSLAISADGKIVLAGDSDNYGTDEFALARYNPDGSLDTGFDGDGRVYTQVGSGGHAWAAGVAIQSDGKIVAAGSAKNNFNFDFALARYMGDAPVATATIAAPARSSMKAGKLKRFAGTAGPTGHVAKVEIALQRVDRKLQRLGYCRWLRNSRAIFRGAPNCNNPRFIAATGQESWSYTLKRRLRKGSYNLFVRVTLDNGDRQTVFSAASGNLKSFKLR